MDTGSLQEIESRHAEMKQLRAPEERAAIDIARMLRPDDRDIANTGTDNTDGSECFDSSPLHAAEEFHTGMFVENVNPAERWMHFTAATEDGDTELANFPPVKEWLWNEAGLALASLSPAVSGFYTEAPAQFADLGAFGLGIGHQEEWLGRSQIIDRAIPWGQSYIDVDAAGIVDTVNREFRYSGRQMKQWFRGGAGVGDLRDDERYTVIHHTRPNPEFREGFAGPRGMRVASTYISSDAKNFRKDDYYYELPYWLMLWNKRAGRVYPRGPGHLARSDMNQANEMGRSTLTALQFAAEPMYGTRDEDIMTAADIEPHAILPGAVGEKGEKYVVPIDQAENLPVTLAEREQVRNLIREAFRFSLFQIINRPQMTASEFLGWKEERLRALAPYLVRVQAGLAAFVTRRYRILSRAGQTTPPPPELARARFGIRFVSPLAKAQEAATGRALLAWVGAVGQIATAAERPDAWDNVDLDFVVAKLHETMSGLPGPLVDPRQRDAMRQARAAEQQQMAELQKLSLGSGIAAEIAHADQAKTLASGRRAA